MRAKTVDVPVSLLLNPGLPASAKLVWVLSRLGGEPLSPAVLEAWSGLSRPTVL